MRIFTTVALTSTLVASVASANEWATATPLFGTVDLTTGFTPDPHQVSVTAGGSDATSVVGAPDTCLGKIAAAQPDVRLNFTGGQLPLRIFVNSETDTTLVVNAPDGSWHCNDDGTDSGLNPLIQFDAPPTGQYDIWVGVYGDEAATAASTLSITELTTVTPASVAAEAAPPAGE
jgi:hypothetical protein